MAIGAGAGGVGFHRGSYRCAFSSGSAAGFTGAAGTTFTNAHRAHRAIKGS